MIAIKGTQLALIAAVVARVANDTQVRWKYAPHSSAFDEISSELKASISVYDLQGIRYVKFDFNKTGEAFEVEVGPKPVAVTPDVPEGDGPPTTTGPSEPPRMADCG